MCKPITMIITYAPQNMCESAENDVLSHSTNWRNQTYVDVGNILG